MGGERVGKSKQVFETVKDTRVSKNKLAREKEQKANNNNNNIIDSDFAVMFFLTFPLLNVNYSRS